MTIDHTCDEYRHAPSSVTYPTAILKFELPHLTATSEELCHQLRINYNFSDGICWLS